MATKPLISDYLVSPGSYIREALEHYGMTQQELADRTGRPTQAINEIINGKKEITEETAFELESVLGTPAHVWLNLECTYRYGIEAKNRRELLITQEAFVSKYPYALLARFGYVPATRNRSAKVQNLLGFFGVAKLNLIELNYSAAFRKAAGKETSPYSMAAWLRIGEREAEKMDLPEYDKSLLTKTISTLRAITNEKTPIEPVIQGILGQAGVALVIAPHLPQTFANGAVFWYRKRPVIILSCRGVYVDIAWFTLFHEIGHILLHEKSVTFIEGIETKSDEENEADRFACDTLIPPLVWLSFRQTGQYDPLSIRAFAEEIGIHPAIVVGRLLHEDGFKRYPTLMHLRSKMNLS